MIVLKNKKAAYPHFSSKMNHGFPFHPFMMNDLQQFFGQDEQTTVPKVNITEDDKGFTLQLAVPGVTKENIKIDLEKEILTISASANVNTSATPEDNKETATKFLRKEFSYQSFKRSFTIPENTDETAINAKYENGILHVVLPKKENSNNNTIKTIAIS